MSIEELQKRINSLHHWATVGCGNHGCQIMPPKGMGTNAGCSCTPHAFSEVLLNLAADLAVGGRYAKWDKPATAEKGQSE
jgi:hypothetical protein